MSDPYAPNNDGIFAALADLELRRYATPQLLKIVYVLGLVLIVLGGLAYLILGLTEGGFIAVVALIGVPILTLLWILYLRVMVELGSVLFRIAGDISTMARTARPPERPQEPPPSPNV